jgi:hypothetical protein
MPFAKMPDQERYIPSFAFRRASINRLGLPSTSHAVEADDDFIVGSMLVPKFDDVSMLINYHGYAGKTFKDYDIVNVLDDSIFQTIEERELNTSINVFDDPNFGLLHDGTFREQDRADRSVFFGIEGPLQCLHRRTRDRR